MLHGAGAVGRTHMRGQEYPVYAPVPSISEDFTSAVPGSWSFTRASANATNSTYLDGTTVTTYTVYAANAPRVLAFGLLMEPSRTNYFLNSEAPVTQTVSVVVGTYVLWMLGAGTVTPAFGTAVGTISNTPSHGTFSKITVTTAGTLTITVVAPVVRVQLEFGNTPTSYIQSSATAQTRAEDRLSKNYLGGELNQVEGTYWVEFYIPGMEEGATILTAGIGSYANDTNADIVRLSTGANGYSGDGYTRTTGIAPHSVANSNKLNGSVARVAYAVSQNRCVAALSRTVGPLANPNLRPPSVLSITLGGGGASPTFMNGFLRRFRYWRTALDDLQLAAVTASGYFRDGSVFDFDLKQATIPRRLFFYKGATSAQITTTDAQITDAAGAAYNTYGMGPAAIIPRTSPQGVWLEQGRTQYLGNSNAPITRVSATLGNTAGYILFVNGSGSARVTAGTAIPIFDAGDTATQGNPIKFNIAGSANGTVNVTVTGTLNWFQMEQLGGNTAGPGMNIGPSSFIQSGSTGQRGTESLYMKTANWYNAEQHTYFYEGSILVRQPSAVLMSVWNSTGEREQLYAPMTDGNTGVGMRIIGEKHNNNINYGGIYQAQADQPLNTIFKAAYSITMSRRAIAVNGVLGDTTDTSGPSLYPIDFIINNQRIDVTNAFAAASARVRRVRMFDYALTDAELVALTA